MTDQELSFDESHAQEGPVTCSRCSTPLTEYWTVDGEVMCEQCMDEVHAEKNSPVGAGARVAKAIGLGLLGMLAGAIVWYAVARFADLQIGFIAILLGFLVAKGVMMGSEGRGGPGYQLLAVVVTYLGIGVALTPLVVENWIDEAQVATDSLSYSMDSLSADKGGVGDSLQMLVNADGDSLQPISEESIKDQPMSDSALDAELAAIDSAIAAGGKSVAEPALPAGAMIVAGLLALLVMALTLPIGVVIGGSYLSGLIFAIALFQAYSQTKRVEPVVSGPHQVGAAPA